MEDEQKKLEILVVEDKAEHQEAARSQLGNHNLIIAKNFYEAVSSLETRKPEVLLTDMMFPLGLKFSEYCPNGDAPTRDTHEPRPLGYAIALYASRPHIAVPRIGLLTDANHHSDAISATFDDFLVGEYYSNDPNELILRPVSNSTRGARPVFRINNSLFSLFDSRDLSCDGKAKDWDLCLYTILKEPEKAGEIT